MNRQVDVKALVSHIVRGDGSDKCRICLGDTSEGQVYLEDTVMMEGDKPVTLAELLEIITGVEVEEDSGLPQGICYTCLLEATASMHFRQLFLESNQQWSQAVNQLSESKAPTDKKLNNGKIYIIYNGVPGTLKTEVILEYPNPEETLDDNSKEKKVRNVKKCSCPSCGKQFMSYNLLDIHLKGSVRRACSECGVILKPKSLMNHLVKVHNKAALECASCSKVCEDSASLFKHINEQHNADSKVCGICSRSFPNERALRAHMYAHTLFHCHNCRKIFDNRRCYKFHQRKCKSKEKPVEQSRVFICDHCGIMYDKKPSLRIHIVQKHLNVLPFVCQTCGKRTSTLAHLRSHETTHTKQRVIFRCECGAKFRTDLGFQLHQRIHSGVKPYQCEVCGDRFLSASRRLDHIKRRHRTTKEMPHGCEKCTARFVRPFELKKHYLTVHYSVVDVKPLQTKVRREM